MQRRHFVASTLAASAVAITDLATASAETTPAKPRDFYELRRYSLQTGPQVQLTESFVSDALVPGLNRLGFSPIGVFHVDIGPETPTLYVLIPGTSVDALATADQRLLQDVAFMKAAEPFWNTPAHQPGFVRYESSLLIAFEGWPRLRVPSATEKAGKRIFQLRTYESPTNGAHVRKVEMFHHGEFGIFEKTGLTPVFFADCLIGSRMPRLTYMLTFANHAELEAAWDRFSKDPEWKTLSTAPRYASEPIVSNIDNLILRPASSSQI